MKIIKTMLPSAVLTLLGFGLVVLMTSSVLSFDPNTANRVGEDGGRITAIASYSNGVMAMIHNLDDDTYSNYVNGILMTQTLDGEVIAQYNYGTDGKLKTSVNQYGDVTTYNAAGLQASTDHMAPDGSIVTTTYAYDKYNRLISSCKAGATSDYSYDGSILQSVTTTDGVGGVSVTTFLHGKEYQTTDKYGNTTTASYDSATGRRSDVVTNANGVAVSFNYYDQHNRLSYSIDFAGNYLSMVTYAGAKLVEVTNFLDVCKDPSKYNGAVSISHYSGGDYTYSEEKLVKNDPSKSGSV